MAGHDADGALAPGVAFIAVLTGLNLSGVRPTGRAAVVLAVGALLPVAALTLVGAAGASRGAVDAVAPSEARPLAALGARVSPS